MTRSLLIAASAAVLLAASTSATSATGKWFDTDDCTGATIGVTTTTTMDQCKTNSKTGGGEKASIGNVTFFKVSVFMNGNALPTNGDCSGPGLVAGYPATGACGQCVWDSSEKYYATNVCDVAGQWYRKDTECNSMCSNCTQGLPAYVGQCAQGGYLLLNSLTTGPARATTQYAAVDCSGPVSGAVEHVQCDTCFNMSYWRMQYGMQYGVVGNSSIVECGAQPSTAASSSSGAMSSTQATTASASSGAMSSTQATTASASSGAMTTPAPASSSVAMTETEAKAEVLRLQTIQTYVQTQYEAWVQTHITTSISHGANWTAAGCAASPQATCTAPSMCCSALPGGATYRAITRCKDADGVDGCFLNCNDPTHPEYGQCSASTFQGSSVCGQDSANTDIAAYPMTDLSDGCSTGPSHELDGLNKDKVDSNIKFAVPPEQFFADAVNNVDALNAPKSNWTDQVLLWAVLTNAANVSTSDASKRAKVTAMPTMQFLMAYKANNNGNFIVNGSSMSHFVAVDPINYATADNFQILGGKATILGANSAGPLNSTTTGTLRLLNVINSGNVYVANSDDVFIGNVVSSGDVTAIGSSTSKLTMINVTATAGTISVSGGGVSALYNVEAQASATVSISGGSHSVYHTRNAGTLTVSNCASLNLYNVSNTGTLTVSCSGTITGSMLSNIGGTITVTSGNLNVDVTSNTGSITLGSAVTGRISAPTGTTITTQGSGVTVQIPGASASSGSSPAAPGAAASSSGAMSSTQPSSGAMSSTKASSMSSSVSSGLFGSSAISAGAALPATQVWVTLVAAVALIAAAGF